jgi:serine/threonine protein kinase/Tfp pilus assembly protein PilF
MTPERWQQVERLYQAALEREPSQRSAFLREACAGDEVVRQEVESLLAYQPQAEGFIEAPALQMAAQGLSTDQARSLVGRQIGSFKVFSLIGAGGMGEVYRARDIRLGREVAVKVLPAEVALDRDRLRRFLREARSASTLNHPNVATIHESGEADGVHFIAMEYVEGQTLAAKIHGRPLETAEIVDIGIQVADALEEAHSKGITHRDIKPANLMLKPRGQVKVLDFGLAKVSRLEGQAMTSDLSTLAKTKTGVVMGTVGYMSPEQVLGKEVEPRSDLFSLGVVLYEMATGRLPFSGTSATETMDHILHAQPEAMARFNYNVPAELERIVRKCLEKDRERRYQSARELLIDLRNLKRDSDSGTGVSERRVPPLRRHSSRLAFVALAVVVLALGSVGLYWLALRDKSVDQAIDSLAVLPFANTSADPNTEYLSDGITESLINSLSHLRKLRVTARTTAFRYKGREVDPQKAGRDLNVRAVLTGKVVQRGDTLILQAELVDVAEGSQLWGERYSRKLSDVLAVQEVIAKQISEKLRLRLSGEEKNQLAKRYTENAEAYQLYLKGLYSWNKRTEEGVNKGIEYFQQAIEKDPSYALAYASLADCYDLLGGLLYLPPKEALTRGKAAVVKALEIDDTLAEAHTMLASIRATYDWDWVGAEREYQRAIELNPSYATAHQRYSLHLMNMGRTEESLAEIKRALELDPVSLSINTSLGWRLHFARRYEQAIEQYRKTLEMDSTFGPAHFYLGQAYEQKGMYEEAIAEFHKAINFSRGQAVAALGHAYAMSGKRREARKVLYELEEQSKRRYISPYGMALIYTGLGEKDQAFAWLQRACEDHSFGLNHLKVEPSLDSLRSDSRFRDLLRCVGLPP